ncbi:MAG: ATP-dependent Clp protease ATP-binding subunit, partial [Chloroflexi bacterium]|nr:ATP-dependent Clp protease ATP-binding subunit [Chloroflexota bacterium]
ENDSALERRLQPITVDETNIEDTIEILKGVRARYEEHHGLTISDEALESAAELASRYVPDRFLPDKAIDLVDEAASRVRIKRSYAPPPLQEAAKGLDSLRREKEEAITAQQYEFAAELRDREVKLQDKLEGMQTGWKEEAKEDAPVVSAEDICEVVAMWTGIPVTRIASEESQRLLQMEDVLHEKIVGQDEAILNIAKAVRRARAGLKDPRRPIGVFMFLGPTGVGKTYVARVLSEFMFGNEEAMIKLDMSEFMEKHNVSRLIGAPPGYVGYEDAGQLTDTVRRKSYCLILLDEIEKAHPEIFNMLLQIFDDGHLTDAKGRRVDFRNTIVIMTSNVGSDLIRKEGNLGFSVTKDEASDAAAKHDKMKEKVLGAMKNVFRPEFINRLDATVVFHSLTKAHIRQIVTNEMKQVIEQLKTKGVSLELTEAALDWIGEKGYDPLFGARPLRRVIQSEIEDRLSEALLEERFNEGDKVKIDVQNDEIVLDNVSEPALA